MHLERSICYIECIIDPKFVGQFGVNGLDVVAAASVDAHRDRLLPRCSRSATSAPPKCVQSPLWFANSSSFRRVTNWQIIRWVRHQNILPTFASLPRPFVYANTPMLCDPISMTEIRPLRRIDDVALKRWALFTVE